MRYATAFVIGFSLLMSACVSRDEVSRVTSPDGRLDALVIETNCGAPCSFGYIVELAKKGNKNGTEVATLNAAVRNGSAWGVNVRWVGSNGLSIEYLSATDAKLLKPIVNVDSQKVTVSLRGGINDPRAPSGGMLYNRK